MSDSASSAAAANVPAPPGRIYVYVYGGLGNQLFQAAFASVIRARSGCAIDFIVDSFKNDGLRSFLLNQFPRLRAGIAPMGDAYGATVINEADVRSFPPQPLLDQLGQMVADGGRLYLSGFWQNEAYLAPHHDLLVEQLTPMLPDEKAEQVDAIRQTESIGLHMRRQGYGHMGLVKSAYYLHAIQAIRQEKGDIPVHVFSDDPVYSRYLFRHLPNIHMASDGDLNNPLADFAKLSACRHQVIANSSFSWWAAWLAEREGSIVYAPQPWIIPDPVTNPVPERWRRVFDVIQEQ